MGTLSSTKGREWGEIENHKNGVVRFGQKKSQGETRKMTMIKNQIKYKKIILV